MGDQRTPPLAGIDRDSDRTRDGVETVTAATSKQSTSYGGGALFVGRQVRGDEVLPTASELAFDPKDDQTVKAGAWGHATVLQAVFQSISEDPSDDNIKRQIEGVRAALREVGDTNWVVTMLWNYKKVVIDHEPDARKRFRDDAVAAYRVRAIPTIGWAMLQLQMFGDRRERAPDLPAAVEGSIAGAQASQMPRRPDADEWEVDAQGWLKWALRWRSLIAKIPQNEKFETMTRIAGDLVSLVLRTQDDVYSFTEVVKLATDLMRVTLGSLEFILTLLESEGAAGAAKVLGEVGLLFALPVATIDLVDQISIVFRGQHLGGKPATEREMAMALFRIVGDLKTMFDGGMILARYSPRVAQVLRPLASGAEWVNPITIGAMVTYEEVRFLAENLYGPAHKMLTEFFGDLRAGGDPDDFIQYIRTLPDNRETLRDLAPVKTGAVGDVYDYLYGNGRVFGRGVVDYGWSRAWSKYWDDELTTRLGPLSRFAMPDIAPRHEQYWGNMAKLAKDVAIDFIEDQKKSGKFKSKGPIGRLIDGND